MGYMHELYDMGFLFQVIIARPVIFRREMYDTWKESAEAINSVIPDMSVSIADTGEVRVHVVMLIHVLCTTLTLHVNRGSFISIMG